MLQQSRNKGSYEQLVATVIEKVKKQGFDNIKADMTDYETPPQLISRAGDVTFTPDVTATKNESKGYFEIAAKMENTNDLINKWKLLDTLAFMKRGTFQIYVPHGMMKFTEELVRDHQIRAKLIKI